MLRLRVAIAVVLCIVLNGKMLMAQHGGNGRWAFKTNIAGLAIGSVNVAGETIISEGNGLPMTIHASVSYNGLKYYTGNSKLRHIAIQPEFRIWLQEEAFQGLFVGANLNYAYYNVGYIGIGKSLKDNYYQGQLYGLGVAAGYQLDITDNIGVEASFGLGYANMRHDVYKKYRYTAKPVFETRNYIGPNKFSISFVYKI